MKFSNGILQILEGPRGEASWWAVPTQTPGETLQHVAGEHLGRKMVVVGPGVGSLRSEPVFSALIWLLTWQPEGRQTHYLWLFSEGFR